MSSGQISSAVWMSAIKTFIFDPQSLVNLDAPIRSIVKSLPPAIAAVAVTTRIWPLLCV